MASDSIKLYGSVYVALMILAAGKFVFFELDQFFTYWEAFGGVMALATVKTMLIVAYFMHLKWENRALTYLMMLALALTMLLMSAATYSIT